MTIGMGCSGLPMDGRILARAKKLHGEMKAENEKELRRRRDEAYDRVRGLKETDARLRRLVIEAAASALRVDAEKAVEAIAAESLELQVRRAELLVGAGYPIDYIDEKYMCDICHDTGHSRDGLCVCIRDLYRRESAKELSSLLRIGDESFENFDLSYYSSAPDPDRECMETVLETCRNFALRFGPGSPNLLFQGGTGLGKTYLSACIARAVSERGFSVVYDTAVSAMEAFESRKFSRDIEESGEAEQRVRRMLECDLMILDDLGTEMVSAFSLSALYTLINSRLLERKKTVISTNLSSHELSRKYTPQIVSRLEGEFLNLDFVGRDIRSIKKERGLA